MVQGAQYGAVRPSGMKKKRGRYAPIVEEQAKQGLATKSVIEGKKRAQEKAEWEFNKSSREQELKMQQKSLKMQKKQAKHDKYMGYVDLGLSFGSTAFEILDWLG